MAKYVYEYVWDVTFSIPSRKISFKPYALMDFTKTCNYVLKSDISEDLWSEIMYH